VEQVIKLAASFLFPTHSHPEDGSCNLRRNIGRTLTCNVSKNLKLKSCMWHRPWSVSYFLLRMLFNVAFSIETIKRRMVAWLMNWEWFGRSRSRPNRGTVPIYFWRDWGKLWNDSGYPVPRTVFEPSTYGIEVKIFTTRRTCSVKSCCVPILF
jgi:hypothetical protein